MLGCLKQGLKYVLEKAGSIFPNLTLEGNLSGQSEFADADDPFRSNANEYSHLRTASDDDEDEDDQRVGTPPSSLALTRGQSLLKKRIRHFI